MERGELKLNLLLIATVVTLAWTPPTTNEDGTPLTDLAGHRAYCGATSGTYSAVLDVGMETSAVLAVTGRTYFAVTAYDLAGNESDYSDEITWPDYPRISYIAITCGGCGMIRSEWGDWWCGSEPETNNAAVPPSP